MITPRASTHRSVPLRRAGLIGAGVVALAISGSVSLPLPGTPVPQSAQTLFVLIVGIVFGTRDAGLVLVVYLVVGGLGAPVFADGASGWTHLTGPTAGYLMGFAIAAPAVGWAVERGYGNRMPRAFAVMLGGHVLILGLGWTWLSTIVGIGTAFRDGVEPFLLGGLVKSALAATTAIVVSRSTLRSSGAVT